MPKATPFRRAYLSLNQNQKIAVDTLEGPVMVLAGPGTGKTQVLTLRLANILEKTDTPPQAILALTFTEVAAKEMRARLVDLIGPPGYLVRVHTFHGFCQSVLIESPDLFPGVNERALLNDLERLRLVESLIKTEKLTLLRPLNAPFHYLNALLSALKDLKREGITPARFVRLIKDLPRPTDAAKKRELAKLKELARFYRAYQHQLKKTSRLDFEDLINRVVERLEKDPTLRLLYQEKFNYFLVDEYQDTNSAQNRLVFNLASYWGEKANLFAVGDPHQCLPGNTKIITKDGEKEIKEIKVGDCVLSAVGKGYTSFIKVTKTFKRKDKVKLITLTTKSGRSITVTSNHKMFCFIPPREFTKYWYVYLMYKDGVGWRLGTTRSLSIRLKVESGADKIVGIACCNSEMEARSLEIIYSLRYQIPTIVFHARNKIADDKYIDKVFSKFNTLTSAKRLANDLGIDLNQPHYMRDATTIGRGRIKINFMMCSRSYRSISHKAGLLDHPEVLHEINMQTSNPKILGKLKKMGFRLRNKNIGEGFRLSSTDIKSLYQTAKKLEKELPGFIDIKSSIGTIGIQHKPARVMQAGNVLLGSYLPILDRFEIKYEEIIARKEIVKKEIVYDLEVTPSHNFIANGVVVHNSIFRFQGASTENLQEFLARFPHATLINLTDNYRSPQTLLDAAHALITHNPASSMLPTFKLTSSTRARTSAITLLHAPDHLTEMALLTSTLKKLKRKNSWSALAVITRNNQELLELASFLVKNRLPVRVEGGEDVLTHPEITRFLNLLRLIGTGGQADDLNLFTVLHCRFFRLDPVEILKAARLAADTRQSLYSYLLAHPREFPQIDQVLSRLAHWQSLAANLTFPEFFEAVFQESGLADILLALPQPGLVLGLFHDLFHLAVASASQKETYSLSDFLNDVDTLLRQGVKLPAAEPIHETNAVTLTTAHKAKGLEWPFVFVYRFLDKTWGNKIDRQLLRLPASILEFAAAETDPNAEDRRLFYVALTRAQKAVFLTYADRYPTETGLREALPSLFVHEIPEKLIRTPKLSFVEKDFLRHQITFLSPTPALSDGEKPFLKEIISDFKLSVTALNTYLDCPYKFKLNNLYRLPRAKPPHLAFGTAVHSALEKFHRHLKAAGKAKKTLLLASFKEALAAEILSPEEHPRRLKHGRTVLSAYFDYYRADFTPALATEMVLGRGASVCLLEDIPLTGNLDRLDLIDAAQRLVRVVDYKTGRPQTRNEIEGKTKAATLHYKRQLVFYRLLGELATNFPYTIKEVELDFVEPDPSGKFRREHFEVAPEELEALKRVIKQTVAQIRRLEFPRTSDTSLCQTCEFRPHCWPGGLPKTSARRSPGN